MKVVIDEAAYADLVDIHEWIAKDRPPSADNVVARILAATEHLGRHPNTGHKGREPGTYEWVVSGLPYIIVFEIDAQKEMIEIIGVFHGAQQDRRQLR